MHEKENIYRVLFFNKCKVREYLTLTRIYTTRARITNGPPQIDISTD